MSISTALSLMMAMSHSFVVNEHSQHTSIGGMDDDVFGGDVAFSGDTAVVGAFGVDDGADTSAGAAYVFVRVGANWAQVAKLTASDAMMNDFFGWSVEIDGDTIVVGAPTSLTASVTAGAAYVFVKPPAGWADMTETAKLTATDAIPGHDFGYAVGISGTTIVVGTNSGGSMSEGAAYIYEMPAAGWIDATETAKLTASDAEEEALLGRAASISGDTVVLGAVNVGHSGAGNFDGKGAAYVFVKPGSGWSDMTETAKLTASDGANYDRFGFSVDNDGNNIVVGAVNDGNSGSTTLDGVGAGYVFQMPANGWSDATQSAKLTYASPEAGGFFGSSVSIQGDHILVGALNRNHSPMMQDGEGAAYLFVMPQGGWSGNLAETGELFASDAVLTKLFGYSVEIGTDWMMVGAPGAGPGNLESGSAYFFAFDSDEDGVANHLDNCPNDPTKLDPGACGCGASDADSDSDGVPNCLDQCPDDANKIVEGACGCGAADADSDGDLILDCNDADPNDGVGDTPPEMGQCCGGGIPAMTPFMLFGWKRSKRRRLDQHSANKRFVKR